MKTVTELAQQIADQELEACKQVILHQGWFASGHRVAELTAARRPAADRACHPTPQPDPPSPISAHDLAIQWNRHADQSEQCNSLELHEQLAFAQSRAIAADRARRPLSWRPVAVSEHKIVLRPIGQFDEKNGRTWLPANALPTPEATND